MTTVLPSAHDHHIRRLLPRHFKILELVLAGHQYEAIAKIVEMTTAGVKMVTQSPVFQAEVARRRRESTEETVLGLDRDATLGKARSILEDATEVAATKNVELMNCGNHGIELRAAHSILDRAFGKIGQGDGAGMVINISAEHVDLLNLALKETQPKMLPEGES